ncbi:hypothetical protein Sgly_3182 [Syntrophobotulus glycolicus DSM 8271]|uniref:Uncharacterized protein n=1 Tax=Syntrophobotulus glycolicus (strain DSM 8271 / FlGlyR) TaxID=645991 RepID=F0T1M4_SYNGF|nr:hypothetical protein Sgly_3182 [Syntrophobotulus glycolicus DSM 8271]
MFGGGCCCRQASYPAVSYPVGGYGGGAGAAIIAIAILILIALAVIF